MYFQSIGYLKLKRMAASILPQGWEAPTNTPQNSVASHTRKPRPLSPADPTGHIVVSALSGP